jgi:Protein of unknown function (DUF559)
LQGYKFRRQRPIGPFIADFVCIEHRLVIEADGGQHNDNDRDARRTAWLKKRGWRVLRFWNNDILQNPEGVCDTILRVLQEISEATIPSPPDASRRAPPSPASGRGANHAARAHSSNRPIRSARSAWVKGLGISPGSDSVLRA